MKAYKGFNEDMTCRGFQYEEGKEYEPEFDDNGNLLTAKMALVDGKKIKPDTLYTLKNGDFVEVKE